MRSLGVDITLLVRAPQPRKTLRNSECDNCADRPGDVIRHEYIFAHLALLAGRLRQGYLEALANHRRLAEANPEAYSPYVATTLNNLANLYGCQQPELHGNPMARIFLLRALLASTDRQSDACNYARRGLEAAFDPS